jgi:integrase
MANKKTVALTTEQYKEIISTMRKGFAGFRSKDHFATALVLERNLGLRISDILNLRLSDIVKDGDRFRLDIVEQKTQKKRSFSVPLLIYQYLENYCLRNNIKRNEIIFPYTERAVQKALREVCDYLGFSSLGIGTHSFRKWYATEIYKNNDYDIALVQRLLQHSSAAVTQRYIGIENERLEKAIEQHTKLY